MERNFALEYRERKDREDQVNLIVREMEERAAIAAYEAKGDIVLDEG